jgi:hypothetical protein
LPLVGVQKRRIYWRFISRKTSWVWHFLPRFTRIWCLALISLMNYMDLIAKKKVTKRTMSLLLDLFDIVEIKDD